MHCLNIVRCMIVYLDCINIMRFQKKIIIIIVINLQLLLRIISFVDFRLDMHIRICFKK